VLAERHYPMLFSFVQNGLPSDTFEHCTRSWECLPRAAVRYLLDWKRVSWSIGLVFRAGGVVWIAYCAARAVEEKQPVAWLAKALFVYFLFLHNWQQSWYLLVWLPLLPHAHAHLKRAMVLHVLASLAYYPAYMTFSSCWVPELTAQRELFEAVLVSGVPG